MTKSKVCANFDSVHGYWQLPSPLSNSHRSLFRRRIICLVQPAYRTWLPTQWRASSHPSYSRYNGDQCVTYSSDRTTASSIVHSCSAGLPASAPSSATASSTTGILNHPNVFFCQVQPMVWPIHLCWGRATWPNKSKFSSRNEQALHRRSAATIFFWGAMVSFGNSKLSATHRSAIWCPENCKQTRREKD